MDDPLVARSQILFDTEELLAAISAKRHASLLETQNDFLVADVLELYGRHAFDGGILSLERLLLLFVYDIIDGTCDDDNGHAGNNPPIPGHNNASLSFKL